MMTGIEKQKKLCQCVCGVLRRCCVIQTDHGVLWDPNHSRCRISYFNPKLFWAILGSVGDMIPLTLTPY